MNFLLVLIIATAISWVVIPFMWRLAPKIGMMDKPDARKVHASPVPRVGGWGIVIGALVPIAMALPWDPLLLSYLFGSLVLFVFGSWDDCHESGHYTKFLGQLLAVFPVVTYGGLYIQTFPFLGTETLPPELGIPLTVFAMVGVINAINHSDGLDGLAGGESLLTLIALAFLTFTYGGVEALVIAGAVIGGILGFLRYNTHPARVFMGDSGSQFLGFTVAFLAIYLTQRVNTALSPALPALLLGLPVIDILAVLYLRARGGMNLFRATKNHIHHRLLALGFDHYESVIVIYSIQAFFIISAIFMRFEWDYLIVVEYAAATIIVFSLLTLGERIGWRFHEAGEGSRLTRAIAAIKANSFFRNAPAAMVSVVVPGYVLAGSMMVEQVPRDFAFISVALFTILFMDLLLGKKLLSMRSTVYAAAVFVVYLTMTNSATPSSLLKTAEFAFFSVLALAIGLAVRYARDNGFRTTPTDYLIIFVVLAIGAFSDRLFQGELLTAVLVKGVIILYGSELLISRMEYRWNSVNLTTLTALGILGVRGFL